MTIDLTPDQLGAIALGVPLLSAVTIYFLNSRESRKTHNTAVTIEQAREHQTACKSGSAKILYLTNPSRFEQKPALIDGTYEEHQNAILKECEKLGRWIPVGIGSDVKKENNLEINDTIRALGKTFRDVAKGKADVGELEKLHTRFDELMTALDTAIQAFIEEYQKSGSKRKKDILPGLYKRELASIKKAPEKPQSWLDEKEA